MADTALAQMVVPSANREGGLDPLRQWRRLLVLAGSACPAVPLRLEGADLAELSAEDVAAGLPERWMAFCIERDGAPCGVIALEGPLAAVVVSAVTLGRLPRGGDPGRAFTRTDAVLVAPLVAALIGNLPGEFSGMERGLLSCGAWLQGTLTRHLNTERYDTARLGVRIGEGDPVASVVIALERQASEVSAAPGASLGSDPDGPVFHARVPVEAQLATVQMLFREVAAIEIGQRLKLGGAGLDQVRLIGPGGRFVAEGRLGRAHGQKAVRIRL